MHQKEEDKLTEKHGETGLDPNQEIEKNPEAYFARAWILAGLEAEKQIQEELDAEQHDERERPSQRIRHKHLAGR